MGHLVLHPLQHMASARTGDLQRNGAKGGQEFVYFHGKHSHREYGQEETEVVASNPRSSAQSWGFLGEVLKLPGFSLRT